jgi:hypothetical protein
MPGTHPDRISLLKKIWKQGPKKQENHQVLSAVASPMRYMRQLSACCVSTLGKLEWLNPPQHTLPPGPRGPLAFLFTLRVPRSGCQCAAARGDRRRGPGRPAPRHAPGALSAPKKWSRTPIGRPGRAGRRPGPRPVGGGRWAAGRRFVASVGRSTADVVGLGGAPSESGK